MRCCACVGVRPPRSHPAALSAHVCTAAPCKTFETGIRKTVQWYLDNQDWVAAVQSGAYRDWIDHNYKDRTGEAGAAKA